MYQKTTQKEKKKSAFLTVAESTPRNCDITDGLTVPTTRDRFFFGSSES